MYSLFCSSPYFSIETIKLYIIPMLKCLISYDVVDKHLVHISRVCIGHSKTKEQLLVRHGPRPRNLTLAQHDYSTFSCTRYSNTFRNFFTKSLNSAPFNTLSTISRCCSKSSFANDIDAVSIAVLEHIN